MAIEDNIFKADLKKYVATPDEVNEAVMFGHQIVTRDSGFVMVSYRHKGKIYIVSCYEES